jgi:hypothetical protein
VKDEYEKDKNGKFILDENKNKIPLIRYTPKQWQGYCKDTQEYFYISDIDVKKLVTVKFLEQVKRQSLGKAQVFVEIPPGANNKHREFPANFTKGPKIHYVQIENERTCLITAVSSLLHFAHGQEHAQLLFSHKKKFQDLVDVWDDLNQYLVSMSYLLKVESVDYSQKTIKSIDPDIPIITCLRAVDGKEDHTVTIYKKWIFDGNFTYALRLNKESLDMCCSSDEEKGLYESMLHTYIFPHFKDYASLFDPSIKKAIKKKKKNKKKVWRGTKESEAWTIFVFSFII